MALMHVSGQIAHALFQAHSDLREHSGRTEVDNVFEDLREKIADILIEQRVKFNRQDFLNRCMPPGLLIDTLSIE
jgi:hypothetical protein